MDFQFLFYSVTYSPSPSLFILILVFSWLGRRSCFKLWHMSLSFSEYFLALCYKKMFKDYLLACLPIYRKTWVHPETFSSYSIQHRHWIVRFLSIYVTHSPRSEKWEPEPIVFFCLFFEHPCVSHFPPLLPFPLPHWDPARPAWAPTPHTMLFLSPRLLWARLPCSRSAACTRLCPAQVPSCPCWDPDTRPPWGHLPVWGPSSHSGSDPLSGADPHAKRGSGCGAQTPHPAGLPGGARAATPALGRVAAPALARVPPCSAKKLCSQNLTLTKVN